MRRNKFISVLIIVCATGVSFNSVFAISPAPAPVCNIEGVITAVEYKDAWKHQCLLQGSQCPTDTPLEGVAHFSLKVLISSSAYVLGPTTNLTCTSLYPIGTEQTFLIYKDEMKSGTSYGQRINGEATFLFDNWLTSYNLIGKTQRYTSDIYLGMNNSVVRQLQTDLSRDTSIYPEKLVTGYFGQLTLRAVKRFQAKYGIRQTGFVGPITRGKLNELYGTTVSSLTIVRTVGEREGSFLIQKINPDNVEGLWGSGLYPTSAGGSTSVQTIFRIGDDIKYCGGPSEKILSIDFSIQKVTFVKSLAPVEPCPS